MTAIWEEDYKRVTLSTLIQRYQIYKIIIKYRKGAGGACRRTVGTKILRDKRVAYNMYCTLIIHKIKDIYKFIYLNICAYWTLPNHQNTNLISWDFL